MWNRVHAYSVTRWWEWKGQCVRVCLMYTWCFWYYCQWNYYGFFVLKHVCFYLIRVCDVIQYNGSEKEDAMAIRILNKYKYGSIKYTCVYCICCVLRVYGRGNVIDMRSQSLSILLVTLIFAIEVHNTNMYTYDKKIATTPKINITFANTFCYIFISTINIKYFHFNRLSGCACACVRVCLRISMIVCTYKGARVFAFYLCSDIENT